MVVLGQKWLYSGKSCLSRAKLLYSRNVVVFGQNGCIRAKVVVFGQSGCTRTNVVVFGQKWLCSGKVVVFGQTW